MPASLSVKVCVSSSLPGEAHFELVRKLSQITHYFAHKYNAEIRYAIVDMNDGSLMNNTLALNRGLLPQPFINGDYENNYVNVHIEDYTRTENVRANLPLKDVPAFIFKAIEKMFEGESIVGSITTMESVAV